jgi:CYTH domain-containing protein
MAIHALKEKKRSLVFHQHAKSYKAILNDSWYLLDRLTIHEGDKLRYRIRIYHQGHEIHRFQAVNDLIELVELKIQGNPNMCRDIDLEFTGDDFGR